ncbi:hypothetical protein R1flu_013986 [Riccia fluitans]|uniref:FZ domain-containing protein n=1 Tax=Riccia fluitans TaxID=41844 RepID=A0ABD1YF45_9MARC
MAANAMKLTVASDQAAVKRTDTYLTLEAGEESDLKNNHRLPMLRLPCTHLQYQRMCNFSVPKMGYETTKSSDLLAAAVTAPGACVNHLSKFMLDVLPFMTCGIHRGKVVSEDCRSECALAVRLTGWIGDEDDEDDEQDEQQQKGKFLSVGR